MVTFVSATFWWIWLLAKRVSAASSAMTSASDSDTPSRAACTSTRSARSRASRARSSFTTGLPLADPDLDVAEPRARNRVADVARLARLALAAVRRAEHHVASLVADGVARAPELVCDARVRGVLEQPALLATLDLVCDLRGELEVQAPVVDGPRTVRGEVQAVVGVGDDLVKAHPGLGQQVDVRHPDQRDPVPAVGPHRRAAPTPDLGCRLARREITHEDPVLDQRHGLGRDALIVPAERPHAARRGGVGHDVDEVGAVAEPLCELVGRQEARPGVARLGAEDPIELGGVAAALVHLQVELARVQHDRELAAGTLRRGEQRDRLVGQGLRAILEPQRPDELVACRLPATTRIGIRAALVLVA